MFSQLTRNKDTILNAIQKGPDGSLIAKQELKIIFPVRYEEADLAHVENGVYVLGIFAIQVGNEYAVNNLPAKVQLHPSDITKGKYNEQDYYILEFDRGAVITDNINVVMTNTLGYYIYNYFIALGRVPWYMTAIDMLTIFDRMKEYTTVEYGVNHVVGEMIVSMIMRDPDNIQNYWRQAVNNQNDVTDKYPDYIKLKDVAYGARNTTSKLMGSYFDEGLNSALLNPSETVERVETILRQ